MGRILFYDPILSSDNTISCASCHSPYNAFSHSDHQLSHGINDQIGKRNAPALFNLAWQKKFMWDGSINHLDVQPLAPISHSKEMNEKKVVVWGTGKPMREFLHVSDMAAGSIYVMNIPHPKLIDALPNVMCSHINIGTGCDVTIKELAETMASVVGFRGDIEFDISKPDGTPRKLLNVSRLRSLGWEYTIDLDQGLKMTYEWFLKNLDVLRN